MKNLRPFLAEAKKKHIFFFISFRDLLCILRNTFFSLVRNREKKNQCLFSFGWWLMALTKFSLLDVEHIDFALFVCLGRMWNLCVFHKIGSHMPKKTHHCPNGFGIFYFFFGSFLMKLLHLNKQLILPLTYSLFSAAGHIPHTFCAHAKRAKQLKCAKILSGWAARVLEILSLTNADFLYASYPYGIQWLQFAFISKLNHFFSNLIMWWSLLVRFI